MMCGGIFVDNFAGGGGASIGIEHALGRPVDFAINHDPEAIAMHRVNHPRTQHLQTSVWSVDPRRLTRGSYVRGGWFSPDCTYHSKARGGKPFRERDVARRRRGLSGIVPYWLSATGMDAFFLENVEEFADWGPLLPDGRICPKRRGMSFRRWHRQVENIVSKQTGLPYRIDMRQLRACEYGVPTTRKRLFVIGRCDGGEIVFPEATHGFGRLPYRTAAECINWSIEVPSIFAPGRDLVENTLRRIARGIQRYVIEDPNPFIVTARGTSEYHINNSALPLSSPLRTISSGRGVHHLLIAPTLINTRNGERLGQAPRVRDIREPYPTVTAIGSQGALVTAFLAKHYGGHETPGASLRMPMSTVTARDHHALVYAFLLKYYGTDQNPRLDEPLHTITTKDRFALVTVHSERYYIADIGMRHLTVPELYAAQGFPTNYIVDRGIDESGNVIPLTSTAQKRMCGNSVPPGMAEVLVRANCIDQLEREGQVA